ncbi:TetR/AcrR family transcriptional regulator [uncultured Shimia sp.]|uniref:TetR/AcrR family transcriptional regulator n=1 Tax=uncultured Shimia sp. TaxID=573152 RepID=UPI00261B0C18|nr:TetR/AcrR family transcriptional regulator [uncultured Shimia sp.]
MNESNRPNSRARPRRSKQDWLNAALDVLKEHGIQAVRVERLAKDLRVAKSGFYYHFEDRDHLQRSLIAHWVNEDAIPFAVQKKLRNSSPTKALIQIIDIVEKFDLGKLDFAMRQWAKSDAEVHKAYQKEMRRRVSHIRGIFESLGFEGDDLEMRTRTFVATTTTEAQLFTDMKVSERKRLRELRVNMLIRRD